MATLQQYRQLTLAEIANRIDPNGDMATVVNTLAQDNRILDDAIWMEGNQRFAHVHSRSSYIPGGSWRSLNQGVTIESVRSVQFSDNIGILETYSEADTEVVDAAANPAGERNRIAMDFIEGLSQTLASTLIYGNFQTDGNQFDGLAVRLAALANPMVYNAGGSGADVTSIYAVQWAPNRCFMAYPRGAANAGIKREDLGIETKHGTDGSSNTTLLRVYRDRFVVRAGLVVLHDRAIGRLANIESTGSSNIFNPDHLVALLNRFPDEARGVVLYCNQTVKTQIDIAAMGKTNGFYTSEDIFGRPVSMFRGTPIHRVDKILNTETALT